MHFAYETAVKYDKDFIRIYFFYEIIVGRARRTKYIYILWSTHKKQTNGFIVTPHKNSKTIEGWDDLSICSIKLSNA